MVGGKWLAAAAATWLIALAASHHAVRAEERASAPPSHPMFVPSTECMACHNSLTAPSGEDLSIGLAWRASMMANSSRDPYWQASVRRETIDHPQRAADIQEECSICHMPMVRAQAHASGKRTQVFSHLPLGGQHLEAQLAADGVSCTLCHQITPEGFGSEQSFVGRFVLNATTSQEPRTIFGPVATDPARQSVMHSVTGAKPVEGAHVRQSELCATCHTLITQAFGPAGDVIGSIPEQVPYLEWRHSAFRDERSCQSCHMPRYEQRTRIASVLGAERDGLSRHTFLGGNFFVLRMLNRFRSELAVAALPAELEASASATLSQLQRDSADVSVRAAARMGDQLQFQVAVVNRTGHKLPSGYPSRRAWLHVTVRTESGGPLFESGAITPDGRIVGNASDEEGAAFEPHYQEITRSEQVQVFESVMQDRSGAPTTGLLRAVAFAKDNRLLPRGFDKATAEPDIAVHGGAAADQDFVGGGDVVRYRVPVSGTERLIVNVELRYQPIAYRWAQNLRGYDAPEPQRFVGYYEQLASTSSTVLATAGAVID